MFLRIFWLDLDNPTIPCPAGYEISGLIWLLAVASSMLLALLFTTHMWNHLLFPPCTPLLAQSLIFLTF